MSEKTDAAFLRDLAARMFRTVTPAQGFNQGDTDQLHRMARDMAQPSPSAGDLAAFGASDAACYLYPEGHQAAERAAYCAGAAAQATATTDEFQDMAAALRNTPAQALREAGYLDRVADMLETTRPSQPAVAREEEDFLDQLRRVNMDRYIAWVGDGEDAGILFDAAELGGEVGELLNVVKKLVREYHGWRGSRATVDDFRDECADVLICLDKLARRRNIDLREATVAKFNATSEKNGFPHRLALLTPASQNDFADGETGGGMADGGAADDVDEFATVEAWEHDDQRELSLLYNHRAHDRPQFNRGQMRVAIRHGRRATPTADVAVREALERIAFLSTNHGGWFEADPFKAYAELGGIARAALAAGDAS